MFKISTGPTGVECDTLVALMLARLCSSILHVDPTKISLQILYTISLHVWTFFKINLSQSVLASHADYKTAKHAQNTEP